MEVKMFTFIFFLVVIVAGQEDDDNVCYRGVKPKLDDLIQLYKNSPSISNVTNFPDINSLIDEVDDIISNITDLNNIFNKSQIIRDTINGKSKELEYLTDALNLLRSIRKEIDEIYHLKAIHNQAVYTCSEAFQLSEKLRKDVNDIKKTGNAIKTTLEDIAKGVEDMNDKSWKVKSDLNSINIPDSLFQQYVCDSNLQSRIQDILDSLRSLAELLKREFSIIIQDKLNKLENNSEKLEKDANEMKKSLNTETPKTDIKVTDATKDTIEDLKKQIKDLEDKLRNMNWGESNENFFKDVQKKLKDLVNEYEMILQFLLSKENIDKAAEELAVAKKTLQLVNDRDSLKADLDDVKKIVDTLLKKNVCSRTNNTVDVEG